MFGEDRSPALVVIARGVELTAFFSNVPESSDSIRLVAERAHFRRDPDRLAVVLLGLVEHLQIDLDVAKPPQCSRQGSLVLCLAMQRDRTGVVRSRCSKVVVFPFSEP